MISLPLNPQLVYICRCLMQTPRAPLTSFCIWNRRNVSILQWLITSSAPLHLFCIRLHSQSTFCFAFRPTLSEAWSFPCSLQIPFIYLWQICFDEEQKVKKFDVNWTVALAFQQKPPPAMFNRAFLRPTFSFVNLISFSKVRHNFSDINLSGFEKWNYVFICFLFPFIFFYSFVASKSALNE